MGDEDEEIKGENGANMQLAGRVIWTEEGGFSADAGFFDIV